MNNLETAIKMLQERVVDDFDWMYVEGAMGHNYDIMGDVKCVLNELKALHMENILRDKLCDFTH